MGAGRVGGNVHKRQESRGNDSDIEGLGRMVHVREPMMLGAKKRREEKREGELIMLRKAMSGRFGTILVCSVLYFAPIFWGTSSESTSPGRENLTYTGLELVMSMLAAD